jgi:ABC-type thiamin/hydroxymethylpyrimidine transport system permease subunit
MNGYAIANIVWLVLLAVIFFGGIYLVVRIVKYVWSKQ